jgi:transcriptional regulator with XRE-family HTH domain
MDNTLRLSRAGKGKRGVTQLDVAKATKIERNKYWRIEMGYQDPTPAEIRALARYFRCSASILFPSLADGEVTNAEVSA